MLLAQSTFSPDWTWLLTFVIGFLTLIMVRLVIQVRSLPPGPFPLPVLGNILLFRGKDKNFRNVLMTLQEKYKDIFTLWLGPKPTIFFCTWDLCHEGLIVKRNDFSGRVMRHLPEIFLGEHQDVVFSDYGPTWETLKKVLSTAVRKYAVSRNLAELVSDVVDRTTETMLKDSDTVDAAELMYLNIYNVLASSSFGVRFEVNDPTFIKLRQRNDELNDKLGNGLPTDALPFLKPFYKERVAEIKNILDGAKGYVAEKIKEHQDTYQSGDIRDFTDAILAAKEEAEAEGKDAAQHLTDGNIHMVLNNLFFAGTDTTRVFLLWIFLILSNEPEIQRKMQEEIDKHIGSRHPVQKDKTNCAYVNSVLTEVLRYRSVLDFTLEHKAIHDTELGGYKIPKGTAVVFYIKGSHFSTDYWEDPESFKPERFMDENGQFINTRIEGYLPFGLGRRSCPGEKLALADAFLITARLLQKHNFALEGGPGSANLKFMDTTLANFPHPYKLVIKKRDM